MRTASCYLIARRLTFQQRHLRTRSLDWQARYRAPSVEENAAKAGSDLGRYETVATSPVAASFQDVPGPDERGSGARTARTLPAMQPLHLDSASAKPPRDWRETRAPLMVQGVRIPSKPIAPGEEDCCMSGCVHCVYTLFAEDQQAYEEALGKALEALKEARIPKTEWPVEVAELDGGQGDALKKVSQELDPSLSAFLAFENKMKKKS